MSVAQASLAAGAPPSIHHQSIHHPSISEKETRPSHPSPGVRAPVLSPHRRIGFSLHFLTARRAHEHHLSPPAIIYLPARTSTLATAAHPPSSKTLEKQSIYSGQGPAQALPGHRKARSCLGPRRVGGKSAILTLISWQDLPRALGQDRCTSRAIVDTRGRITLIAFRLCDCGSSGWCSASTACKVTRRAQLWGADDASFCRRDMGKGLGLGGSRVELTSTSTSRRQVSTVRRWDTDDGQDLHCESPCLAFCHQEELGYDAAQANFILGQLAEKPGTSSATCQ